MSNLGGKNVSEDTDKDSTVDTIVAGTNIDNIDSTDPRNPIINASGGGGGATFHGVLVERTTTLARGIGTTTADFVTEVYDTDGFADLGADNDRVTIPAGVTKVQASAHMDCSDVTIGSSQRLEITQRDSVDALVNVWSTHVGTSSATSIYTFATTPVIPCSAGDYFKVSTQCSDSSWTQTEVQLGVEYKDGSL